MSSLSSALGNAGAKLAFSHAGKTYAVSYLTQAVKAGFEQWLKGQAMSMLPGMRAAMTPPEYEAERSALTREILTGKLAFHSETAQEALKSPEGMLTLTALLFGCPREEAMGLLVERTDDVTAVLLLIAEESSPKASAKNG